MAPQRTQEPSYGAVHCRLRHSRGRAAEYTCVQCGEKARDWAQVHGTDGTNELADFVPMCKGCHNRYDKTTDSARKIAKLTPDQVRDIRSRNAAGVSQRELAKEFGVRQSTISRHLAGKRSTR